VKGELAVDKVASIAEGELVVEEEVSVVGGKASSAFFYKSATTPASELAVDKEAIAAEGEVLLMRMLVFLKVKSHYTRRQQTGY